MALEVVGSSPTTHPIYFPKALFAQDWGVAKRLRPRILIPVSAGSNPATPARFDPLAQSVEHLTFNQVVGGSNPFGHILRLDLPYLNMAGIAQLVSAPDCGSGGRGFEPHYPPLIRKY